ncbi:cohesin domain-containing protein [Massilia pseudoviolaceinigra]|uniref:cohesin domain-containing protein n=1 Tax=Massilia pseudoviolaceinigra TaxID=3057165 RepID=UPI0027965BAE|nr:cohesin domain-containing protein [Massilia sp. CCM 9206]MDQ1919279.1 cohesin domain-containing protein [Massilia sp. CCM 9206]
MTILKKCLAAILLAASTQAFAIPTLSLSALPAPATVGSTVDLAVKISDISDLYTYQFTLTFDSALLKANSVTEGAFLSTAGPTFSDGGVIDNATGMVSYVFNTRLGAGAGAFGSGNLAHFSFDTLAAGSAALTFSDVLFLDSNQNEIAVTADNGSVQVVPEPATYMMMGVGLLALGAMRRRQLGARA